ncbi:MAG: extracellular solute-binding protein [Alphaproteobacteria bacterium]|nr:extracellular solute-binding protein [Alphaproteobacteria bacterium]
MDVLDQLNAVREGKLTRRTFNKTLLGAGVSLAVMPVASKIGLAAAADQATYFTWGGYDVPDLFAPYIAKHGEPPNFSAFGGSEEALTKIRGGFVPDVAHPCNQAIPRWVASGLFQAVDTSKLSNFKDLVPSLVDLPGNMPDGKPYMIPMDWGRTSITYRTDLFDLQGKEESWGMLWDERYKGRMGVLASGADTWWCAAIYAGVDFKDIATDAGFKKTAEALRKQRPLMRLYTDDTTTLEQALASGEMVAAMTWNSSAVTLKSQGIPVAFANPKEGALTWVCGAMIHKDAPQLDKAHDIIDAMLSTETGKWLIGENGYGHSNAKSFDLFSDEELKGMGLSRNPNDILSAGKFQIPQTQEFETKMNQEFEQIKAGF